MGTSIAKWLGLTALSFGLLNQGAMAAGILEKIKKRKELLVGMDPGFIPFEMKRANGEMVGFDVDMLDAFAKELGVKAKHVDTRWDGIIPALMTGKFDCIVSGLSVTPERAKQILFSDGYYKAGLMALVSSKHATKIKTVQDLNNPAFKVGTKLGTTGDIYAAKHLKKSQLKQLDSESDASTSVRLGKIDAFIYDKPYLAIYAKRNEGKVFLLDEPLNEEELAMGARKKDKELVDAFNTFLKKWRESGEYDKAIKKNFVDMPWIKDFPELK